MSFRRDGYERNNGLRYSLKDHLNSTSVIVNGGGTKLWEERYYPYGESRYTYRKDQGGRDIDLQTSMRYTGQRFDDAIGLYYYNARYYDPVLARFAQADTIVPEPGNPQSLNRYSYVGNQPTVYSDPSGHCPTCIGGVIGGIANAGMYLFNENRQDGIDLQINISFDNGLNVDVGDDWKDLLVATGEGAVAGALIGSGQPAGISMAANIVGDHVENYVSGEDFSATEHLTTGIIGAVEGYVGGKYISSYVKSTSWVKNGVDNIGQNVLANAIQGGIFGGIDEAAGTYLDDGTPANVAQAALLGAAAGAVEGAFLSGWFDAAFSSPTVTLPSAPGESMFMLSQNI
ncbi:MAG: RHS repeat-associated core domain-containing protein, partial [Gammaproteobacteria bacterium]|nr:RHS repeat-associated core domain-containing protein [Gammaproteobacteria bacterium]